MNHAKIVKEIFPITKDDIINDYNKLEQLNCNQIKNMGMSRIGTNTTDYFTAIERLDTKVKTGRSFFIYLHYSFILFILVYHIMFNNPITISSMDKMMNK